MHAHLVVATNSLETVAIRVVTGISHWIVYWLVGVGGCVYGKKKTSLVVVLFMLNVMTYVMSYKLFWNSISAVQFVSHDV